MDYLRCIIERITYQNDDNGYCVIKVIAKGFTDLVTVVGNMAGVNVGCVLSMRGEWKTDSRYGKQFTVIKWEETLPATVQGIEKYLGSGLIKGIGTVYAKKIVERFGADTLKVIEETPDNLIEVNGIGKKRVDKIKRAWVEQNEIKNVMVFLTEHGVGTAYAVRIYKTYGDRSISIVRENPYRLADDIWGIGFKTADKIAEKLGFEKECEARCRSGVLYSLNELSNDGHCYATSEQLTVTTAELLEVEQTKIAIAIEGMKEEKIIIKEEPDALYLPPLYYSEVGIARRLYDIQTTTAPKINPKATHNIDALLSQLQGANADRSAVVYSDVQRSAIKQAVLSKTLVITGGPGTGKTTTILGIISLLKHLKLEILLAAPTGRAAKRMSETCGMESKTIHRMLGFKPPNDYEHNGDNPLSGDVLIVDECSMIDVVLMNSLLKAVPNKMKVIFVGDVDQLPSVGAGNVLSDIISSTVIPVVKLDTIFRQAQGSDIIKNAHSINKGVFPSLNNGKQSDFFFIEQEENDKIPQAIVELCKQRLPNHYGADPIHDIQVLCPMNRSENGAANLNIILQAALNPGTASLKHGGTEYRLGDKVMQIKNNYEKNVFNGDIGIIKSVDLDARTLSVIFDNQPVEYDISELDELVLSYAITIHKSQGSEYPIVIMPFTMQFYVMLQRNLLYTGITRAKKAIVLIGSKKALGFAVRNSDVAKKNTGLAKRIYDKFQKSKIKIGEKNEQR